MNPSTIDPSMIGVTPDLTLAIGGAQLKLLLSVAVVLLAWVVRLALMRMIRRGQGVLSDGQRWWLSLVKNLSVVVGFAGLTAIWSSEIANAALSLAAVAVALVVATKGLILCISGATWRGLSQPFGVGDWIEVGGYSGEVIDESLLSTVLQEIDAYDMHVTGRTITLPNSLLLTQPLVNHGFRKRFLPLFFEIVEEGFEKNLATADQTRTRILVALEALSGEFADVARRYAARIERSAGVRLRDPAPKVTMRTSDLGKLVYQVTVFCPRDRAEDVRVAAMRAFLAER
jgi:small-conductance mechanosensitive channel